MTSFQLGPYTVTQEQQPSPACALYVVRRGAVKIGQCVSWPGLSDCQWLERQQREQSGYAYSATPLPHRWEQRNAIRRSRKSVYRRGGGPKTKADLARELAEAINS